jgi:Ser/Thr protein kinase RdoA (MazF antagonist)
MNRTMSLLDRTGIERLPGHLEESYRVEARRVEALDLGVFRVELADGRVWVARLFPRERPLDRALGDARVLDALAALDYPAERCAGPTPVTVLDGHPMLVTAFAAGVPRAARREAIRNAGGLAALGRLLGLLQTLPVEPGALARPGGAWHHLADGSPADELAALAELVASARPRAGPSGAARYEALRGEVERLDDGAGLPESFVHPDFVFANVVAPPTGGLVVVDWAGAGRAPRNWSLAFLLWSVGFGGDLARIDRAVAGYRRRLLPEPEELDRLEALIRVRPTVFAAWAFCTGRKTLAEAADGVAAVRDAAAAIAGRARAAFAAR